MGCELAWEDQRSRVEFGEGAPPARSWHSAQGEHCPPAADTVRRECAARRQPRRQEHGRERKRRNRGEMSSACSGDGIDGAGVVMEVPVRESVEKYKMNWKWKKRHRSSVHSFHNGKRAKPTRMMAKWQSSLLTMAKSQISRREGQEAALHSIWRTAARACSALTRMARTLQRMPDPPAC